MTNLLEEVYAVKYNDLLNDIRKNDWFSLTTDAWSSTNGKHSFLT